MWHVIHTHISRGNGEDFWRPRKLWNSGFLFVNLPCIFQHPDETLLSKKDINICALTCLFFVCLISMWISLGIFTFQTTSDSRIWGLFHSWGNVWYFPVWVGLLWWGESDEKCYLERFQRCLDFPESFPPRSWSKASLSRTHFLITFPPKSKSLGSS